MEIKHLSSGTKGKFYIGDADNPQAEMTYTMPSAQRMIIDHTEVSDQLRGQKVGNQLLQTAVDYAREHQLKIIPLCPFAASVFKKTPAYADVLVNH